MLPITCDDFDCHYWQRRGIVGVCTAKRLIIKINKDSWPACQTFVSLADEDKKPVREMLESREREWAGLTSKG